LILRFWALSENFERYRKPLAGFINSYAEENRHLSDAQKDYLQSSFMSTLDGVHEIFGDMAFKIYDENGIVDSKFNSALYDAEMVAVRQLSQSGKLKRNNKQAASKGLVALMRGSEQFRKAISIATSDENQLKIRVSAVTDLLSI
jgi:hypothetical protein